MPIYKLFCYQTLNISNLTIQFQFIAFTCLFKVSFAKKHAFWTDFEGLFNKTNLEALVQPLKRGRNPFGNLYRLPPNSHWTGKGSFAVAHFFSPFNSSEVYYDKAGGLDVYFEELDRSFYIQDNPEKLSDDRSSSGSVIKLSEILGLTLENIRMAALNKRSCYSTKVSIHPSFQSIQAKQANVLLLVKIKTSTFDKGKLEESYVQTLKFHVALENYACDSILTYF
ncbi:hypothetical protein DSO57_1002810 [Entomophthora muscae]|uniref:Uncharacterized protein n=1 Tax=Entomophthora muscae TaxID=34485 RepID=A0ACC2SAN7_9FUNG|nr:hypothetical protein DSO57_1002810 [Entomophthora muscae]